MPASKFASRLDATKATVKKTVVRTAKAAKPTVDRLAETEVDDGDAMQRYAERIAQARDELFAEYNAPSSSRVAVATISALLTYGVGVYWAAQVINIAVVAVTILTGSAFLAFLVGFIGYVIALVGSLRMAWTVGKFVLGYEVGDFARIGQSIKESANAKVSLVRGWFTPAQRVTA